MKKKRMSKSDGMVMKCNCSSACNSGGCVYFLGFIGSMVYFISTASSVGMGLLGVLKSLVWPAYVVYGLLKFLGM